MKLARVTAAALGGLLLVTLIWFGVRFLPPPSAPELPANFRGERAVWLGVEWAMEAKSADDVKALARDLTAHHVTDVFAYVSYLKASGEFNPTYAHAAEFTRRMRQAAPHIRLWAWVGVPIQITLSGGRAVENRLEDAATRTAIAQFGALTVRDLGFDGVHLNAEAIANDNQAYLHTLDAIRAALPSGGKLSVAPHALRLTEALLSIPYPTVEHQWTPDYLRAVSVRVDQVAIMLYDSGLFTPGDTRAWTAYQVRSIAAALEGVEVDTLIGLPVSEEWTLSHHPFAESLSNTLYGLRLGLEESRAPQTIDGVALYPYWEISAEEWALVDALPFVDRKQPAVMDSAPTNDLYRDDHKDPKGGRYG